MAQQPCRADARCRRSIRRFAGVWSVLALLSNAAAAADVLTQRYNNERTGSTQQPGLNQATLQDPRWTELGVLAVEGTVYAQPLYVENLQLPGGPQGRDVIFVATGQNNVYAFDAATRAQLWPAPPQALHLGPNNRTTMRSPGCDSISLPEGIGIEATPVIDRGRGVMYVSYRTNPSTTDPERAQQRLRAIDIRTGATREDVQLVPPGVAPDWIVWHRSRAGLLLLDGVVYVAFASRCEDPGKPIFHGWILAHDAVTLRRVGAFQTTPDSSPGKTIDGGGIWQGAVGSRRTPKASSTRSPAIVD
jgi:hypothetical protein